VQCAETAETAARRGRKQRAKTCAADCGHVLKLLVEGRMPKAWIAPEHILELRARVRLRKTLVDERHEWQQRIQRSSTTGGAARDQAAHGGAGRAALAKGLTMPHVRAKPSVTPMRCGRLPHGPRRHVPLWTTSKDRAGATPLEGANRPINIMSTEPPPGVLEHRDKAGRPRAGRDDLQPAPPKRATVLLDGHLDRRLPQGATSAPSRLRPAEERLVDLHDPAQPLPPGTYRRCAVAVQHRPRGLLGADA
jgi:hypothetical protein